MPSAEALNPPDLSSNPHTTTDKPTQILQGAMQVFLKQGYQGSSMDRVAAKAGVSKQTLYSHFQDKEGLFLALVKHMATGKFQLVWGSVSMEEEPEIVLRQLAQQFLTRICTDEEYLNFIRLLVGESRRFPQLTEVFIQCVTSPSHRALTTYLSTHPDLDLPDPETHAWIFIGSLISYVFTQEVFNGKTIMPLDAQKLVDQLIQMITG